MVKKVVPVTLPVTLSLDEVNLEKQLNDIVIKFKRAYVVGIKKALLDKEVSSVLIKACQNVLIDMQAEYFSSSTGDIKKDPTQFGLGRQMSEIENEIKKNLIISAESVTENGSFQLLLLSDKFIGIGTSSRETEGIPWLYHFLEGSLEDNLIWISKDTFDKLNSVMTEPINIGKLGRYGDGLLWTVSGDGIPNMNRWLKAAGSEFTVKDLLHPQSGMPGDKDWFAGVVGSSGAVSIITRKALATAQEIYKKV